MVKHRLDPAFSSAQFASVHALGSNQQIFLISIKNSLFNVETEGIHKVREMGRKEKHKIMSIPIFHWLDMLEF
jgi:hypothetical protein